MCKKKEVLNYLKQYRHDLLNDLQVIKGYLALKNIEEAQRYLEQVIIKARDESKLAFLGDVDFVYELITFNWQQNYIQLQVDIEHEQWSELENVRVHYPFLEEWIRYILNVVKEEVHQEHENCLFILLEIMSDQLFIMIEFKGKWRTSNQEILMNIKEKMMAQQATRSVEITEDSGTDSLEWKVECTVLRA